MRRGKRKDEYDDTNFSVLNTLNYELTQAEQETIASKIQSSLESATGEYLDTWGDWFGVYRKDGWDDDYYRERITRYLLLKRSTIPAIIDALVDFLNDNDARVEIYEPWKNIFYTNKSKLNGEDHLMGYYYRFAIIDISIDRPFPPEIIEVIRAFKPAGVLFYVRLDVSKNPSTTPVQYPFAFIDVSNKTELDIMNGLHYDIRGNINLSQQASDTVTNNIFHTNNSLLNGEDVLAGAFGHGRDLLHLASVTTLKDLKPTETMTFTDIKTELGEADNELYMQTKDSDNRVADITIPKSPLYVHTAYAWSADGTDRFTKVYPTENYVLKSKEPYTATGNGGSNQYPASINNILFNPDILGKSATIQYKLTVSNYVSGNTMNLKMNDAIGTWETHGGKSDISGNGTWAIKWKGTFRPLKDGGRPEIDFNTNLKADILIEELRINEGTEYQFYTPAPSEDPINAYPTYKGVYTSDNKTQSTEPGDYTWYPINEKVDQTNTKLYSTFDVGRYLDNYHSKDYQRLVTELGETQALNTLFNTFYVSTKLRAMLSPTNGLKAKIQLYDFMNNAWHTLSEPMLTLNQTELNLPANRITDYLNDNKLLFIRYVFPPKDNDTLIELDMLNLTFSYRLGDGYSLGLQSTVECLSEIPLKGLTLSSESVELGIGETAKVTATPVPANTTSTELEWEITDTKIATVDTSGNITGVAIGETTLTVYGEDRTVSATCSVSVKARHTLYSNSTDFGDYDYSGNTNLSAKLNASSFSLGTGATVVDDGDEIVFTLDGTK